MSRAITTEHRMTMRDGTDVRTRWTNTAVEAKAVRAVYRALGAGFVRTFRERSTLGEYRTAAHFALPTWDENKGWVGGAPGVVYAFVCRLTLNACVYPARDIGGARMNPPSGPNADVRIATRAEADAAGWVRGWKVAE